ncbi:hypothetical protein DXG01_002342 [Tephrocybe rancida]|nr:hypothetical protein DXG01_002342 [Tephrocybe rancida]
MTRAPCAKCKKLPHEYVMGAMTKLGSRLSALRDLDAVLPQNPACCPIRALEIWCNALKADILLIPTLADLSIPCDEPDSTDEKTVRQDIVGPDHNVTRSTTTSSLPMIDGKLIPSWSSASHDGACVSFQSVDGTIFHLSEDAVKSWTNLLPDQYEHEKPIPLPDTSATIQLLFGFVVASAHPGLEALDIQTLGPLSLAADRYKVYPAMAVCAIRIEECLPDDLMRHTSTVIGYALKSQNEDIMDKAAPLLVGEPPWRILEKFSYSDRIIPLFKYLGRWNDVLEQALLFSDRRRVYYDSHAKGRLCCGCRSAEADLTTIRIMQKLGKGAKSLGDLNGMKTNMLFASQRANEGEKVFEDNAREDPWIRIVLTHTMRDCSLLLLTSVSLALAAPEVKLGQTTLVGRDVTGFKQDFFGAIPFAEPPIGKLRLQPPVLKLLPSDKPTRFNATNFGPGCFQAVGDPSLLSEDCLTINILRPSGTKANAKLPVLFWIYGGSFVAGRSSAFNGSAIVAHSVARETPLIYVNFNYRLGPLGFPQGQEADDKKALNLALRDEIAALEWVQANIGAFGGDKTKVTAFGNSAGAIMTSILFFNSPLAKLVRGVILQSGSPTSALTFPANRREINWQRFVAGVPSCTRLAKSGHTFDCLKSANSSDILQGVLTSLSQEPEPFPFDPTFDGPEGLFPDIPSRLFAKGKFARIPLITGTNLDEGTGFTPPTISTEGQLRDSIIANFSPPIVSAQRLGNTADKLLKLYPDIPALGSPFNTGNETFGLSRVFKQAAALLIHGSEVVFVYGDPVTPTPSALALSSAMIEYWVSFATSLDPNDGRGVQRPHWDQYTTSHEVVMQLNGANLTVIPDDYRKEQIAFINAEAVSTLQTAKCQIPRYVRSPSDIFIYRVLKLSPFLLVNAPDAEITFQSSDNILFRIHKLNLTACSEGFSPPENSTFDEIVPLSESSATLELLFQFIYPRPLPELGKVGFEVLALLAEAAEKYRVFAAMNLCAIHLIEHLQDRAEEILLHGLKHSVRKLVDCAAPLLVDRPLEDLLPKLPDSYLIPWVRYHAYWTRASKSTISSVLRVVSQEASIACCPSPHQHMQVVEKLHTRLSVLQDLSSELLSGSCCLDTTLASLRESLRTEITLIPTFSELALPVNAPEPADSEALNKSDGSFSDAEGYITFKSNDEVTFCLSQAAVKAHTKSLLPDQHEQPVPLPESSETLKLLFKFLAKAPHPNLETDDFSTLGPLSLAAYSYGVHSVMSVCNIRMMRALPYDQVNHTSAVMFYALKCQNHDLMDKCAPSLVGESYMKMIKLFQDSNTAVGPWFEYLNKWDQVVQVAFSFSERRKVSLVSYNASKRRGCDACKSDKGDLATIRVMRRLGEGVKSIRDLDATFKVPKSEVCCSTARTDIALWKQIVQAAIREIPSFTTFVTVHAETRRELRLAFQVPNVTYLPPIDTFTGSDGGTTTQHTNANVQAILNLDACTEGFSPPEHSTFDEIVPLTESSETLELLFQYIYPRPLPDLGLVSFDALASLAEAAEKYRVFAAMNLCTIQMIEHLQDHSEDIFLHALKHGIRKLAELAAPLLVDHPLEELLPKLSDRYVITWVCRVVFRLLMLDIERVQVRYHAHWTRALKFAISTAPTSESMSRMACEACYKLPHEYVLETIAKLNTRLSVLQDVEFVSKPCTSCSDATRSALESWRDILNPTIPLIPSFSILAFFADAPQMSDSIDISDEGAGSSSGICVGK